MNFIIIEYNYKCFLCNKTLLTKTREEYSALVELPQNTGSDLMRTIDPVVPLSLSNTLA